MVKNPPANAGDLRDGGFNSWVRKIPCKRAWQLTPVFLPEESHGQRSLAGYSAWGCKESDMTEVTEHGGITLEHHCSDAQIRDQKLRGVEAAK